MTARIKFLLSVIMGVIFFTIFSKFTWAAEHLVVINEISPISNPEWVELYKNTDGEVSLEDCILYLNENVDTSQKIVFTSSDIITSDEKFKLIQKGDYNWTTNWLNNNGDKVSLNCTWGEDSIAYGDHNPSLGKPKESETIGRSPDGSGNFYILDLATPEDNNSEPPAPSPTPTPTPNSFP